MVVITTVKNMFWGVTIDAGKRYSQVVTQAFHLSMAALEPNSASGEHVQVMVQHGSAEFLLCSLHQKTVLQQPLDLVFAAGEELSFSLTGKGVVHLTGYLLDDGEDESDEDYSDEDSDAPSLVDTEGDESPKAGSKRKAIAALSDAKKQKFDIGDDDDDDDDEDDEDFFFDENDDDDDDEDDEDFSEDELTFDEDEDSDIGGEDDEDETPKVEGKNVSKVMPKGNKSATPKADKSATPKGNNSATPKGNNSATPKGDKSATPKGNKLVTPKGDNPATPKGDKPASAKKETQKTPNTQKQNEKPETPSTPLNGESAKKKKKKKKKNKEGNASVNESTSSSPEKSSTESTPKVNTPGKRKVVAGGTVVEDLKLGHGPEAKAGKMVSVYYVGTLGKSNKQFDSVTSGKPFRFRLKHGEVIKGWDNGLEGMKVGGKRKISVPANQAYGNQKQGPIPANSALTFEVELKAVN